MAPALAEREREFVTEDGQKFEVFRAGDRVVIHRNKKFDPREEVKFQSASRRPNPTYVVSANRIVPGGVDGGVPQIKQPIRVKFRDHRWNALSAQEEWGWDNETRYAVVAYLLNHPDFGRLDGTGIMIDTRVKQRIETEDELIAAAQAEERELVNKCQTFFEAGEDVVQCSNPAKPGEQFCAMCIETQAQKAREETPGAAYKTDVTDSEAQNLTEAIG